MNELIADALEYDAIIELLPEGGTLGISDEVRAQERATQLGVFIPLSHENNTVMMALIDMFGGWFRSAIKEYRAIGKIPTPDQLIRYSDKHSGKDIKRVAKQMLEQL